MSLLSNYQLPQIISTGLLQSQLNTVLADIFSRTRTVTVVGSLPSAATAGAGYRAFVTDATGPTFGATVVGGGSVKVPVYSDGSAWKVG